MALTQACPSNINLMFKEYTHHLWALEIGQTLLLVFSVSVGIVTWHNRHVISIVTLIFIRKMAVEESPAASSNLWEGSFPLKLIEFIVLSSQKQEHFAGQTSPVDHTLPCSDLPLPLFIHIANGCKPLHTTDNLSNKKQVGNEKCRHLKVPDYTYLICVFVHILHFEILFGDWCNY